jgi:hypothetical protein
MRWYSNASPLAHNPSSLLLALAPAATENRTVNLTLAQVAEKDSWLCGESEVFLACGQILSNDDLSLADISDAKHETSLW